MAHYAFLDINNTVTTVIVGADEDNSEDLPADFDTWEEFYSDRHGVVVKRCSYNTFQGVHNNDGTPYVWNENKEEWEQDESVTEYVELPEI